MEKLAAKSIEPVSYVPKPKGSLVFHGQIDRIFHNRCGSCHRPDQSAPFNLLSYMDVSKRADFIAQVIGSDYMPPWLPDPTDVAYAESRRLTIEEKGRILQWIEDGVREGPVSASSKLPVWPEGWHLGPPDLIAEMPRTYSLPAEGMDVYRNFIIPMPVPSVRFVRAVEFKPGNPKIVHHAVMFIDRTDSSRKREMQDAEPGFGGSMNPGKAHLPDGFFLGWTPGKTPFQGYDQLAWALTPGTDMVLQIHMRPTGKPESIRPTIGLYFADNPPEKFTYALVVRDKFIDLPAGKSDYRVQKSFTLPIAVNALSIYPHAHYLGKNLRATAQFPNGRRLDLLHIPNWDFDWQDQYRFEKPIRFPAGTVISMDYIFDNSSGNPANLYDPPKRIRYGQNSTDEMAELMLQVVPDSIADLNHLRRIIAENALLTDIQINEKRLEENAKDTRLRVYLARRYLRTGDSKNAEKMFRSVLEPNMNPTATDATIAHHELGLLHLSLSEPENALEHFEKALTHLQQLGIDYNTAVEHFYIGNAYVLLARYNQAAEHYRSAIMLNPQDPDYATALAKLPATGSDQQPR